jgi:hypothetical protein
MLCLCAALPWLLILSLDTPQGIQLAVLGVSLMLLGLMVVFSYVFHALQITEQVGMHFSLITKCKP